MNIILFNLVLLASCGFALFRGAAPERLVATAMLTAAFATFAVRVSLTYTRLELTLLVIDLLLLVALVGVALRANRFWPLWLASCHTLAVGSHFARAYLPDLPAWTYQRSLAWLAYFMLLILVLGCQRHWRREREFGQVASWSPWR